MASPYLEFLLCCQDNTGNMTAECPVWGTGENVLFSVLFFKYTLKRQTFCEEICIFLHTICNRCFIRKDRILEKIFFLENFVFFSAHEIIFIDENVFLFV